MKKATAALLAALSLTVLFASCELLLGIEKEKEEEGSTYEGGDIADYPQTRTFRAQSISPAGWYDVPATIRAAGTKCVVYVEDARLGDVSTNLAKSIAKEFDLNIHGKMRSSFGTESDMDDNGVVILLLLDIVDGYAGSGGYVAGYFDSTHMFSTDTFAKSNEAEMLFMDIDPADAGDDDFYGTLAHEFQHLINYANTFDGDSSQDLWINEGLSAGAEYVYSGQQVEDRIDWFNNDPTGAISYGNNFFVWDGYFEEEYPNTVLDNYATVYLFFQWLRIHASNGTGIYKQILTSPYKDYRAVTNAAASNISASFSSWDVLLRTWMGANLLGRPSGYLGYKGIIDVSAPLNTDEDLDVETWIFSPGENIYRGVAAAYTPIGAGPNIKYAGFTYGSTTVDTTSPYGGDVVMTYNANSDIAGVDEEAPVAPLASIDILKSLMSRTLSSSSYTPPASYAVDVSFGSGGGLHPDSHRPRAAGGVRSFDKTVNPFSAGAKRAWSGR